MKKNFCLTTFFLTSFFLFVGCSQSEKVKNNTAIDNTEISKQQVDSAFKRMWENVTLTNLASYMKTDVADDFFAIDADGVTANMEETLADTARLKMLESLKFKFFDQKIKVFDNVAIINGRVQAFSNEKYAAEILYTAVFVKQNGVWKYKNWQGTWSKNSPPPPAFTTEKK
ncbi:MAG: nuclear transport factor 2 family protein [Bacteroidetes bacterium]|nr:nuclear transport factor 2 family protein [Bacteroidota bacterium]MBS1592371.1 nuclear transport factor 2 family protein [Bacteroidota bacterium]